MTSHKTRAVAIFAITSFVLAILFFTLPINIFDGQIDYIEGSREFTVDAPLSLSYFIGLGYEEADMQFVEDFRLTTKGIIMAVIFMFGLPALLAYRIYLKSTKS